MGNPSSYPVAAFLFFLFSLPGLSYGGSDSLRFLVLGDMGGLDKSPYTTHVEKAVGAQMGKIASEYNTHFVVGLGDNFYYYGVSSVHDKRFRETFEDVYTAKSLQTKWYMIAGNHDHRGDINAQIEYTQRSSRWTYPSLYYTQKFTIPGSEKTLSLIMIDTIGLCGNSDDRSPDAPSGPACNDSANSQWSWVEDQLKHSSSDYIIVAGHYPVYSIGEHGPTSCLEHYLLPMLYKYRVTAYFAGHDHNLQHLSSSSGHQTKNYFVVGCANFIESSQKHKHSVPSGVSKFFWADQHKLGGFGMVKVSDHSMTFNFLDSYGNNLYKPLVMQPRN